MIFTLGYIPFVLIAYYYFGVSVAGLFLVGAGVVLGSVSWLKHRHFKELISPFVAIIVGFGAYFSGAFIALKLYPLLLSLLFLTYFTVSVWTKRYPLVVWVEKFKKRPLTEQEINDVIVSHWFWIAVLAFNTLIHLYLVIQSDTVFWALYSFVGWYLYFGMAMILQLGFAHREWIFQAARNIWGYGLFGGLIIMGFIPAIGGYFYNRLVKKTKPHIVFQRVTAAMFRLFFRAAPGIGKIEFIVDPNYNPCNPYIYVATHESWLDYPLMGSFITDLYHLTNKKDAFSWSIRGIAKLLGVIDGVGAHALHALLQKLREGSNVLIFPEGSRETDATLLPFKRGAFSLSIESGVSIVPVILSGTRLLVPKGTIHWQKGQKSAIKIELLEPIIPYPEESAEALKQRVWDVMNAVQKNHNG
ncbi:MAG TPA: lysophospholipid acyltransferase family protein [Sulfuricurvum sp.]|nr:lysophospholipid acyltransferase family protein [Sulfuricurvum sp.]